MTNFVSNLCCGHLASDKKTLSNDYLMEIPKILFMREKVQHVDTEQAQKQSESKWFNFFFAVTPTNYHLRLVQLTSVTTLCGILKNNYLQEL